MKTLAELKEVLDYNKLPKLDEAFYEFGELADKKKFNEKNPEIIVKGVGKYTLDSLKTNIVRKLEDLARRASAGEFDFINEQLNPKGILNHFVKAVLDVENEMKSPNIKRKLTMRRKEQEQKDVAKKIINEKAPPDPKIEDWIKSNKERFIKQYGKEKGIQVLYSKAWAMYGEKK
jgi:hypothetical protein